MNCFISEGDSDCERFNDSDSMCDKVLDGSTSSAMDVFDDSFELNEDYKILESQLLKKVTKPSNVYVPYPVETAQVDETKLNWIKSMANNFLRDVYDTGALGDVQTLTALMSAHPKLVMEVSRLLFKADLFEPSILPIEVRPLFAAPHLVKQQLIPVTTPGDGSCFYNSISYMLLGSFNFGDIVRCAVILQVRKHYPKVRELMMQMDIQSLDCVTLSTTVRHEVKRSLHDSFNSLLCPVLVSAAIGRPLVIIRSFAKDILDKLNDAAVDQFKELDDMVSNGFLGIIGMTAGTKMAISTPLYLFFENGDHYSPLIKVTSEEVDIPFAVSKMTMIW